MASSLTGAGGYDCAGSFTEILQRRSKSDPDRRAYIFLKDGETEADVRTHRALDLRARTIARSLLARLVPRDRVVLAFPPGLDFVDAFFGCLYAGVLAVPASLPGRRQSLSRLESIAADSGASLILTTVDEMDRLRRRAHDSDILQSVAWSSLDQHLDIADGEVDVGASEPGQIALLQYTSGSTGDPKGVMVSHANLMANSASICQGAELSERSTSVCWLPHFHDMGLVDGILQPLYSGFPAYLMSPIAFLQRPIRWLKAISHFRATYSGGPNFAYDLCVRKIGVTERTELDLSCWRDSAYNGAEPVKQSTVQAFSAAFAPHGFRGEVFRSVYGLAEATLVATASKKGRALNFCRPGPALKSTKQPRDEFFNAEKGRDVAGCGGALGNTEIAIVDPTDLKRRRVGSVGEIWLRGSHVASGYWRRPDETAATFRAFIEGAEEGPYLRTGDLGFMGVDGELFVTGRLKEMLLLNGRNIYPQDIEQTASGSNAAFHQEQCAAFSVEIADDERLVIALEVRRDHLTGLRVEELTSSVREAIADEHDLQAYAVLLLKPGGLPRTTSGKVRRTFCERLFAEDRFDPVGQWQSQLATPTQERLDRQDLDSVRVTASRDVLRKWIINRIARELQIEPDEINDEQPLSALGISSITAVGLAGALETRMSRQLPPTLLYDYPSVEALIGFLLPADPKSKEIPAPRQAHPAQEPIAVIGLSCRFPGAQDIDEFWNLLASGVDAVDIVPPSRRRAGSYSDGSGRVDGTPTGPTGGFLSQVDMFDAAFFGIAPREARAMDPQQRLLLEVAWEAFEQAALSDRRLKGSATGVFIGASTSDYARHSMAGLAPTDPYSGTGLALSMLANRLSYLSDFRGPSLTIDTACSSSLVAVHQACQSLRLGESDMAVAGGVNLILDSTLSNTFGEAGMLSAGGRCKTFDETADGYVRGEGCGVVVLKRLSDAILDSDRIHAVIRGSAVVQDGQSNGLTAPSGLAQQAVIRAALQNGGVDPTEIDCLEAHGTGTALGDPIELNALRPVLLDERPVTQPLCVGSVKTNIGHLEAAAGIAGLIKLILALKNGSIPPHLHFSKLNPYVEHEGRGIVVPHKLAPWPKAGRPRRGAVSSFGFGGTNAHMVVESAPENAATQPADVQRPLHVLTLSAKTEAALGEQATRYARYMAKAGSEPPGDSAYTANIGRSKFDHRLAVIGSVSSEIADKLDRYSVGDPNNLVLSGRATRGLKIAFLFSGQGAHFRDMGRGLFGDSPVFRTAIEHCDEVLRGLAAPSIADELFGQSGANERATKRPQTEISQSALFALEFALAKLWASWGVRPAMVVGHSLGEYAAACIVGAISLEDSLKLVTARDRLMQSLPRNGAMAAVFASEDRVLEILRGSESSVSIAAVNAPAETVVSGAKDDVERLLAELAHQDVRSLILSSTLAYHSKEMASIEEPFEKVAGDIEFLAPTCPFISTVTGGPVDSLDGAYWRRQLTQPVRFAAAVKRLEISGCNAFLEIGPGRTLLALGRQSIAEGTWLASLRQGREDWRQMLESLAQLHVNGVDVDWEEFDAPYQRSRAELPTYPFQRQRYWAEPVGRDPQGSRIGPEDVSRSLRPVIDRLAFDPELKNHADMVARLETLAPTYMALALSRLGLRPGDGPMTLSEITSQFDILPRHHRLLMRCLNVLCEEKLVEKSGDRWRVLRKLELADPSVIVQQLRAQYPVAASELDLFEVCAEWLANVLTGAVDPMNLLAPNGDLTTLTQLYANAPLAKATNSIVVDAIALAASQGSKETRLQVLEIGAGTGAIASGLAPVFDGGQIEYVFTDVSPTFVENAETRFEMYQTVRCQCLDIERGPADQNVLPKDFDVVIASNVLHATDDVRRSLIHARQMLTAGGMLILVESTEKRRHLDLVFGLLSGWWRFRDHDLRADYPLLSTRQWRQLLAQTGFEETHIPTDESALRSQLDGQAVILAKAGESELVNRSSVASNRDNPMESTPATEPALRAQLASLPAGRRRDVLQDFVAEQVRDVLGFEASLPIENDQGFWESGMDSLMAVQLRSRLERRTGLKLPTTIAFDAPNIAALARYLEGLLVTDEPALQSTGREGEVRQAADSDLGALETMSDGEAEAELIARLLEVSKSSRA